MASAKTPFPNGLAAKRAGGSIIITHGYLYDGGGYVVFGGYFGHV